MSRGLLSEAELKRIASQLPAIADLQRLKGSLTPDVISIRFPHDSWVPVAAVALSDAIRTTEEAAVALHECLAHRAWYLEHRTPPQEISASFLGRFFATDLALRLHSGAEHLANAIIFMLGIGDQELKGFRVPKANQASNVGNYLLSKEPEHPITIAVAQLGRSPEWRKTLRYRDRWTHEQPPNISQLGLVYRRTRRWSGGVLQAGASDAPEYSVDDLLGFMAPAYELFVDTLRKVSGWYKGYLSENACVIHPSGDVEVQVFID
jgi:hypothetical protein